MKKKKTTIPKSVYRNQNIQIRSLFEKAPSSRKVLCVVLDYAKEKHVALCCDGQGEILKKPFPVENNPAGVDFLCKEIQSTARRRKIKKETIFIGGEDEPSYVANFVAALSAKGYLVMRVSAREAKKQRENMLASTDNLDLLGIAKCLLSRRCSPASSAEKTNPVYRGIRELSRQRRSYVRQQTACSNRIHTIADQLFPGFLNSSLSGLTTFKTASLSLMKERFSSTQFARRKQKALTKTLRGFRVKQASETASQLIELAKNALPPVPERIAVLQSSLTSLLELYECLEKNALLLREQSAALPGELGDPSYLPPTGSLCAYAGIVPAVAQIGGPDSPAVHLSTRARCNHILKDYLVQGAS